MAKTKENSSLELEIVLTYADSKDLVRHFFQKKSTNYFSDIEKVFVKMI